MSDRRPAAWRARQSDAWPDEKLRQLLALWAEGMGPSAIGAVLGISKNAVVGKANRLDLQPRKRVPARQGKPLAVPVEAGARGLAEARKRSLKPAVVVAPPALPPVTAPLVETGCACCWPLGDPGARGFRFCGAQAPLGSPYCLAHRRIAYVRIREVAA